MSKFDNIKPPKNIKEETKKTIEKGRLLKKKKKLKNIKIASIVILFIVISISPLNTTIIKGLSVFNNLFNDPIQTYSYLEYVQDVDTTKTINGVSLTIDQIIYDGHLMQFSYTIKSKNKLPNKEEDFGGDLLDLDADVSLKKGDATFTSRTGKYVDDYTYVGIDSYMLSFKGHKAPKKTKIKFTINSIYASDSKDEELKGPFEFKFKISPNTDVIVIDANKSKDGFTVDSVEISPYSIAVNYHFQQEMLLNSDIEMILGSKFASNFGGKFYKRSGENEDAKDYEVRNGIIYDSSVIDNVYGIGYHDSSNYIEINFLDSKHNTTNFKFDIKEKLKK
ncbi:DUF4179 domain-containing protein [Romboutsia sp.]|uniref:DUF4179 domain-containing protein n=1 Tax=Romboutsia sp. TaxID=1965302 RepID=UPI003F410815